MRLLLVLWIWDPYFKLVLLPFQFSGMLTSWSSGLASVMQSTEQSLGRERRSRNRVVRPALKILYSIVWALPCPIFFTLPRPALLWKKVVLLCLENISETPWAGQAQGKGAYNIKMVAKSFGKICLRVYSKKIVFSPKIITRIKFPFLDKQ